MSDDLVSFKWTVQKGGYICVERFFAPWEPPAISRGDLLKTGGELLKFYDKQTDWYAQTLDYSTERARNEARDEALRQFGNSFSIPSSIEECITETGDDPGTVHVYVPLREHTGLFRTLAGTEPTTQGILEFAGIYGLLGIAGAEPVREWAGEISRLRRCVDLWDSTRGRDLAKLQMIIEWLKPDLVVYNPRAHCTMLNLPVPQEQQRTLDLFEPATETDGIPTPIYRSHFMTGMPSIRINVEQIQPVRRGDRIRPALAYLQEQVNTNLRRFGGTARTAWNRDFTRLSLRIVPRNLIGALWFQFARSMEGASDYRQCQVCQKWYEVSPDAARTDRVFCSDACRFRAYRKRQAQARELHKAGKSVEEIAAELNAEIQTIKGWVSKPALKR
jgi:predicted nucleic acid-binding Zn ribbon protein